jgi:hypothetical protein
MKLSYAKTKPMHKEKDHSLGLIISYNIWNITEDIQIQATSKYINLLVSIGSQDSCSLPNHSQIIITMLATLLDSTHNL